MGNTFCQATNYWPRFICGERVSGSSYTAVPQNRSIPVASSTPTEERRDVTVKLARGWKGGTTSDKEWFNKQSLRATTTPETGTQTFYRLLAEQRQAAAAEAAAEAAKRKKMEAYFKELAIAAG